MSIEDVGVHPDSMGQHWENNIKVAVLGLAATATSAPSQSGFFLAAAGTVLATLNVRSGMPIYNAWGSWTSLAKDLENTASSIETAVQRIRGGDKDLWAGEAAEQFVDYVDNTLISGIEGFQGICEEVADEIYKQGDTFGTAAGDFMMSAVRAIVLNLAAKASLAIPKAGYYIHEALVLINIAYWIYDLWMTLKGVWNDIANAMNNESAWAMAFDRLSNIFGSEAERKEMEADSILERKIPSILDDPEGWAKA